MQLRSLAQFVPRSLNAIRKGCGLLLVFVACSSMARADFPVPTPEIDPGSVGSALTLLGGGFLMLTARFRRR
jgi:hypothetical protein